MHLAGDSACSLPPQTISEECLDTVREWTPRLAKALKVVGLINIQYCVQDNKVRSARPVQRLKLARAFCALPRAGLRLWSSAVKSACLP